MKTLIVDDELVSRKKMEKIMSSLGEYSGFESGPHALTAFKESLDAGSPFNLVTLDVSMPEMDGLQVLLEIRAMEQQREIPKGKRSKVIMVTCQTDRDCVFTAIQAGCDDYVIKPFDKGIMAKKFEKLGFEVPSGPAEELPARRLVMQTVEEFKEGTWELPVLPQIIQEILDATGEQSGSAEQLARIVEKDAVITIKLIYAANSPIYRATEKVEDVVTAIRLLGLDASRDIATAVANKRLFDTTNRNLLDLMQKLWIHSVASACCAKALSASIPPPEDPGAVPPRDRIFQMGLVHDIGCVLLLRSLGENPEFQGADFDREELLRTLYEVHTSFGAALLESWDFPKGFVEVAKCHEWSRFESHSQKGLLMVNLADRMTSPMGFDFFDRDGVDLQTLQSASLLGIGAQAAEEICKGVKSTMEETLRIFQ